MILPLGMIGEQTAPGNGPTEPEPSNALEEPAPTVAELAEPDYPPPGSVPLPPPPVSLRTYARAEVEEVNPATGSVLGGTKVTLSGVHLFRASIVRVGGVIAQTIGANEPRELRVLTPPADHPGPVDVVVENPFVPPLVLQKAFRYEPLAAPKIAAVAPDHVGLKGGAELTITGEGFVSSSEVLLNGKPASGVRFISAKAIDLKVPAGEDGRLVDVTVKNPDGQSVTVRRAFMYDKRFG